MELDLAIVADAVVQRPDGKIDILGAGFDTIFAPSLPAMHPRLVLSLRFLLSSHETEHAHRLDVVIQAPDGGTLARAHADAPPLPDEQRSAVPAGRPIGVALVLGFENIVVQEYGAHQVVIQWDGNEARPPLRLFVEPAPPPPPGQQVLG